MRSKRLSAPGFIVEDTVGRHSYRLRFGCICTFDREQPTNSLHVHDSFEVCLVTGGSGNVVYDGRRHRLGKGSLTVADPGAVHEIDAWDTFDMTLYFFQIGVVAARAPVSANNRDRTLDSFLRAHVPAVSDTAHLGAYLDFFDAYAAYRSLENPWIRECMTNFAFECLEKLSVKPASVDGVLHDTDTLVDAAIRYIHSNVTRRLTVAEIARNVFTSPRNLQHVFRRRLDTTVTDFIANRRVSLAASRLLMGFRVGDVAEYVGIPDPAQFSRLFKKYTLESPREYRRNRAPFDSEMHFGARHVVR